MTPEDESIILAKFTQALTGRYGPLKPAQAIARCADYIRQLRADKLAWAEIDRLFNDALEVKACRQLKPGSVSRLYHVAIRRSDSPGPSPLENTTETHLSGQAVARSVNSTATSVSTEEQQAGATTVREAATNASAKADDAADSRLLRLKERREAKKRMDQA